ncbi:alpha-S2-casein-like [Elephas maximus indicus]|uniref:alpha-S2-casein-like n=1 Tax=Elephas maximus indicus TaxID=99487 RepID=UPI0021171DF1|nr:alpha-S2-casein-like [Elephas maximus indicus]
MRFFIFICLLAVALAKHEMKHLSSSEEVTKKIDEMESASSSSSEKSELTDEEKIYLKQLYRQAYRQYQTVMNPWTHMKTKTFRLAPVLDKEDDSSNKEPTSISQEETLKKVIDMDSPRSSSSEESAEVSPEKIELSEEEMEYLKQLVKLNQVYEKFAFPQAVQAVHPPQTAVSPWRTVKINTYPFPILRNF